MGKARLGFGPATEGGKDWGRDRMPAWGRTHMVYAIKWNIVKMSSVVFGARTGFYHIGVADPWELTPKTGSLPVQH